MISVENFYWVLYDNLLKPTGLDAWYYAPFGRQDVLIQHEFRPQVMGANQHVLFHFDQEPLYNDDLGPRYDLVAAHHSGKILRILANSERSQIKKKICQSRQMADWYYFYHGFAALDWFRDTQHISNQDPDFDHVYLVLNHLVRHKRSYRMSLTARLMQDRLESFGKISFHGTARDCWEEINDPHTQLSERSQNLVRETLCDGDLLPLTVDGQNIDGAWSARAGHREYQLWQNSLLHVVPETIFYDNKMHLTEKIFKPIVAGRPFILVGAPNNLAYLRSYGFQTFDCWIDESYDGVHDPDQRLDMIVREISKLCEKSCHELQDIYHQMGAVLHHNKRHFFGRFREIIVDELVDNFDRCVRAWNNGRVDGRHTGLLTDPDSIKSSLML